MFELKKLRYDFNACEPYICEEIMNLHYSKHHQTYVDNCNTIIKQYPHIQNYEHFHQYIKIIPLLKIDQQVFFKNNLGGHINHTMLWDMISPGFNTENNISKDFLNSIIGSYGSLELCKEVFIENAMKHFGSGWTWMIYNYVTEKLEIKNYNNQDTPFFDGIYPIMGLDLWEHAYYLQYKNRKKEYFSIFWNIINWSIISDNFVKAKLYNR